MFDLPLVFSEIIDLRTAAEDILIVEMKLAPACDVTYVRFVG